MNEGKKVLRSAGASIKRSDDLWHVEIRLYEAKRPGGLFGWDERVAGLYESLGDAMVFVSNCVQARCIEVCTVYVDTHFPTSRLHSKASGVAR